MMSHEPIPDLSHYDTTPTAAGEWLLSDHPWAVMERLRRAAITTGEQFGRSFGLKALEQCLTERELRTEKERQRMRGVRKQITQLKAIIAAEDAIRQHTPTTSEALRHQWEQIRRSTGETTYTYPAHLIGERAAKAEPPGYQPPPRTDHPTGTPLEELNHFERWRIAFIKAGIEAGGLAPDASVKVLEVGGYMPVQVVGTVWEEHYWAYHHRYGCAWMGWGGQDPFNEPEYETQMEAADTGPRPGTEVETLSLIITLWNRFRIDQLFPTDGE